MVIVNTHLYIENEKLFCATGNCRIWTPLQILQRLHSERRLSKYKIEEAEKNQKLAKEKRDQLFSSSLVPEEIWEGYKTDHIKKAEGGWTGELPREKKTSGWFSITATPFSSILGFIIYIINTLQKINVLNHWLFYYILVAD